MNTRISLTGLAAAAAALLLSTSIAFASPTPGNVDPAATATTTAVVERRGGPPAPPTRPAPTTPGANLPAPVRGPLSNEVEAAITAGILDEWHAYHVYAAVIDQFGAVRPFTSIQRAEAKHADAWATIFERYNIPLPARPVLEELPEFASLADACAVAASAEIANLTLYDEMLTTLAAYPDMVQVATALRDASTNNHLPAFERCAGTTR